MAKRTLLFFVSTLAIILSSFQIAYAQAQEQGAEGFERIGIFVNQSKINMYTSADKVGRTYFTSREMAFDVFLAQQVGQDMMYLIEYPFKSDVRVLTGQTLISKSQAVGNEDLVRVFSDIPTSNDNFPSFEDIPFKDLIYTGTIGESHLFSDIQWHKVTYKKQVTVRLWISAKSEGIFRFFGTAEQTNKFLKEVSKLRLSDSERNSLLKGEVKQGFSKRGVTLAFGEPFLISEKDTPNETWNYECCKVSFNKNDLVSKVAF